MAGIIMTTTTQNTRISQMAGAIFNTCKQITGELEDYKNASDIKDVAGKVATSKRELIMGEIAKLASQGNWTPKEVGQAVKLTAKMNNSQSCEKALATFIGETKHAAHPDVRDIYHTLVDIRDRAWQAETDMIEGAKGTPDAKTLKTPLRKTFKRSYHALIKAMHAVQEGVVFVSPEDLVAYAEKNNPDHDAEKVAARLAKIHADLSSFYVDFPVDDIGVVLDTLRGITEKELAEAYNKRVADEGNDEVSPQLTQVTPQVSHAQAFKAPEKTSSTTNKNARIIPTVGETSGSTTTSNPADMLERLLGDNLDEISLVAA